eukprot:gene528-biopygen22628
MWRGLCSTVGGDVGTGDLGRRSVVGDAVGTGVLGRSRGNRPRTRSGRELSRASQYRHEGGGHRRLRTQQCLGSANLSFLSLRVCR